MSTAPVPGPRTAAALAARHRKTEAALQRVHDAITRLRREKAQVSVAAVSRRADVSRTFLYNNPRARAAVAIAIAQAGEHRVQVLAGQDDEREATWRERALNAEDALKAAHAEILAQRTRIGELLGQVRDLEAEWTKEAIAADHHREHHPQAARPHPHHRQPHPRRDAQGRQVQPPVPRQAHRRPRSPARSAEIDTQADQSAQLTHKAPLAIRRAGLAHFDTPSQRGIPQPSSRTCKLRISCPALLYRPRTGVSVSFPWACELGVLDSFTDLVRGVVHVLGRHGGIDDAAGGRRGPASPADRPEGRAAVVDDRVARGHGARGGGPVPAGA